MFNIMAKKPEWLFRQSGVIPFLVTDAGVEIVLVTSRATRQWGIPKGVVEADLTPQSSAVKEAMEEAGVIGQLLDTWSFEYTYSKWGGLCRVRVFPLRVREILDDWQERTQRDRMVVSLSQAHGLVKLELQSVFQEFENALPFFGNG